ESLELKAHGLENLRKELLQTAVEFYQEFVKQHGDDETLQAERGLAYHRLAFLTARIAPPAEALAHYPQAIAIFEELMRAPPSEPDSSYALANACIDLALLYIDMGRFDVAEANLCKGRDIQAELVQANPSVAKLRRDLAASHNNLGLLYLE